MNLLHGNQSLPIMLYGMPRIGNWIKLIIDGVETPARQTKWGKLGNTYWLYKNVAMYVHGRLPDGAVVSIEGVPDNFGLPEPQGVRKSYYKAKAKPVEAEPAGA